jgi:hypothetical protein
MATMTASPCTLAIAEDICFYSEHKELFALTLASNSVSESALDVFWTDVKMLKDLFLLIPGCFEYDYGLVSTKILFFVFFPTKV